MFYAYLNISVTKMRGFYRLTCFTVIKFTPVSIRTSEADVYKQSSETIHNRSTYKNCFYKFCTKELTFPVVACLAIPSVCHRHGSRMYGASIQRSKQNCIQWTHVPLSELPSKTSVQSCLHGFHLKLSVCQRLTYTGIRFNCLLEGD